MINETKLKQVVESAKAKTSDARWLRAIDKAAAKLAAGELFVTLLADGTALVTSANGSYRVNGHCQCEAAKRNDPKCYHRAAKRLTEMMEAALAVSSPEDEKQIVIAQLRAAWQRKYTDNGWKYNLGDTLLSRFGCNKPEYIPVGYLRDLLNAVA
jgi:hypothetical protein